VLIESSCSEKAAFEPAPPVAHAGISERRQDETFCAAATSTVVAEPRPVTARVADTRRLLRVIAAFTAVYLIWGSTYLGIRFAIASISPFLMAGVRFFCAGALLYGFMRLRGARPPNAKDWRTAAIVGGCLIFVGNGGVTYAEQFVSSGTVAVLIAIVPAFMALLGWLTGTGSKPRAAVWFGIAVATIGVAVMVHPSSSLTASPHQTLGIGIVLFGAAIWSAGSLYGARSRQTASPFLMAAMQMLCGGAFMIVTAVMRGELRTFAPAAITLPSMIAMVYLVLVGSIVGFTAYLWLLRNVEPTRVATYAYVNPIVAVLLGRVIGGERFTPQLLTGSALVVAGVALIVTFRAPSQK
jgi:drug/metabolite transporter (DMT)-like permease